MQLGLSLVFLAFLTFIMNFSITFILTSYLIKALKKRGNLAEDYHKVNRPKIPSPGGPAILFSTVLTEILLFLVVGDLSILSIALVTTIAGAIGFVDDIFRLGGKMKPILLLSASLPILVFGTYDFHVIFPIFGGIRLPIVYPILVLAAIPIVSNATNMIDVLNGVLSGFMAIVTIPIIFALLLKSNYAIAVATIPLLASSLSFYLFHRHPSRIFPGDTGSLSLGAMFCAIAIIGGVEIVAIVALLPAILNSFFVLSTVKKIIEHRGIKTRPTMLLPDGRLAASKDPSAPATLVRLLLFDGPLYEREIAKNIFKLASFSAFLAILTAIVTWWI